MKVKFNSVVVSLIGSLFGMFFAGYYQQYRFNNEVIEYTDLVMEQYHDLHTRLDDLTRVVADQHDLPFFEIGVAADGEEPEMRAILIKEGEADSAD